MSELTFIHRFSPAAEGSSGRTLLLLHGTGGDENDLLPLGRELDPVAALLSVRGNVSENGMPRFFRRLAEGVFDEADVIRRAHELADFVGVAATHYEFDPKAVIAVGYSNGANIAAGMLFLRPEVLAGGVLFRAMVPLVPPVLPDLAHARVIISSGKQDPIVPVENAERLAAMFRKAGAKVTLRFESVGRALISGDIAAAKEWLANL
ncbi:MAG: phospholipase/carboxylesterase [Verrucomicrobiota bacterium]|jgi:phospholipase/carboxylesterase